MLKTGSIIILCILLTISCKKQVVIEGFEAEEWKVDKLGCKGKRDEMASIIIDQKEKILGLSEADILSTLGRADFMELSKRNQKFYFYYLRPGPQCENRLLGEKNQTLQIRLNSVGYANEVLLNKDSIE